MHEFDIVQYQRFFSGIRHYVTPSDKSDRFLPHFVRVGIETWRDVIQAQDLDARAEGPNGQDHPKDETLSV